MECFEQIDVNVFGNFIKSIGGSYVVYGESIINSALTRQEFHQCFADGTLWERWESFLSNSLHVKMIEINLNYLKSDGVLCKSLVMPQPSDDPQSTHPSSTSETLPFPQDGISLAAVEEFINICGGKEMFRGMTTTEVNNEALMPLTFAYKSSYCGLLDNHRQNCRAMRAGVDASGGADNGEVSEESGSSTKPCAFISHAWKYQFLDVLDAITTHFDGEHIENTTSAPETNNTGSEFDQLTTSEASFSRKRGDVVIWFDLFTNNQHLAPDLDFHWWSTTFKTAIQSIGRTIMVLSPWENPVPFTRAWCLFEIYCTVDTGTTFEVAMCQQQKEGFIAAASDDLMKLRKMTSVIDVERSEAWNPLDLQRIFDVVLRTVGFSAINTIVLGECRRWLISTVAKEATLAVEEYTKLKLLNTLGLLHYESGGYDRAFSVLEGCLERLNEIEGKQSHSSIQRVNNLAIMMDRRKRHQEASVLFQKCLEMYEATVGTNEPDYFHSMNSLAVCRQNLGEFEESSLLFRKCFDFFETTLGDNHSSTLGALGNLGISLDLRGCAEEALDCFERCVQGCSDTLGASHVDTLRWCNSLGISYKTLGRTGDALDVLLSTFKNKAIKFGRGHDSTVLSLNNFCQLVVDSCSWDRVGALEEAMKDYCDSPEGVTKSVWGMMYTLTLIYLNIERYDDCQAMCKELIQCAEAALASEDPTLKAYQHHQVMCESIQKVEERVKGLPDTVSSSDFHEHPLTKTSNPYGSSGFECDVCSKASVGYVYHCEVCGFDSHIDCIPSLVA